MELEEPEEDREEPEPLELAFEGEVSVGPAEIALVTLDPTGTRLVRRGR